MSDITERRQELRDLEYAEGYAEAFLNSSVATQLKVLREQRGLKQAELAKLMGTTQTAVSRAENVNYSSWNIGTLKKFAHAFKLRLHISFETFGSLLSGMDAFDRESLQRASHEADPILWAEEGQQPVERRLIGSSDLVDIGQYRASRQDSDTGQNTSDASLPENVNPAEASAMSTLVPSSFGPSQETTLGQMGRRQLGLS